MLKFVVRWSGERGNISRKFLLNSPRFRSDLVTLSVHAHCRGHLSSVRMWRMVLGYWNSIGRLTPMLANYWPTVRPFLWPYPGDNFVKSTQEVSMKAKELNTYNSKTHFSSIVKKNTWILNFKFLPHWRCFWGSSQPGQMHHMSSTEFSIQKTHPK